jgi:hypothetical protein
MGGGGPPDDKGKRVRKVGGNYGKGEKYKDKKKAEWEKGKLARERENGMRERKLHGREKIALTHRERNRTTRKGLGKGKRLKKKNGR